MVNLRGAVFLHPNANLERKPVRCNPMTHVQNTFPVFDHTKRHFPTIFGSRPPSRAEKKNTETATPILAQVITLLARVLSFCFLDDMFSPPVSLVGVRAMSRLEREAWSVATG